MELKTLYATPPGEYRLMVLRQTAAEQWPDCQGVSEINDGAQLAVYLEPENPATDADWQAIVDAHDPAELTLDEQIEQDVEVSGDLAVAEALSPALKGWLMKDKDTFVTDVLALTDAQFKTFTATAIWMIVHATLGRIIGRLKHELE